MYAEKKGVYGKGIELYTQKEKYFNMDKMQNTKETLLNKICFTAPWQIELLKVLCQTHLPQNKAKQKKYVFT